MARAAGRVPAYPFPEALRALPRDASAVVEASAGTGKTYLVEHLVADRIVRGDARLEEILVVTFTEKATAELVRRLRALVERLLAHAEPAPPGTDPQTVWLLDDGARGRLLAAQRSFDLATITTIHGFCQRVLTEDAFAGRRLLVQERVDSKRAFAEAFREAVRGTLATDPDLGRYLGIWLQAGKTTGALERLLDQASTQQHPWGVTYDEARLRAALATFARLPLDATLNAELKRAMDGNTANTLERRVRKAFDICRRFLAHDDAPTALLELDVAYASYDKKDMFSYAETKLRGPLRTDFVAALVDAFLALADAAPPLELALAQLFLPHVRERLAARKAAAGRYDFDDMLNLVAEALRRPGGGALAEALRRRYKLAVIDEFQDTDAVQWEIFRTVFHGAGGRNSLVVIGDPKQAIYGFRGADVTTYAAARREIAGGAAPTLALDRNFRSTPALLAATNAVFADGAAEPFFTERGLFRDAVAVRAPREAPADAPEGPAITLMAVGPVGDAAASELRLRHVRPALTSAIADQILALRDGTPPVPLREIFVLTRTNVEARQIATTLRARGVPHVLYNQERLYQTEEARQLRDLLAAVDEPRDPARRMLAALTPFFGLALEDLPALAADPTSHPIEERLCEWRALADARSWPRFFERIIADSGLVERELLSGGSARRLTNLLHLSDLLRAQMTRAPVALGELVRHLTALVEGLVVPADEEGNVQRLEGDRDAVQIMSIHKSKGLEADHVFLYGAFSPWRGAKVQTFEREGRRWLFAGKPRRAALGEALRRDAECDDQRLLYVGLTRARRRLYLPYAGDPNVESDPFHEDYWRVNGAYRHVHHRLRALYSGGETRHHFETRAILCPAPPDATPARIAAAVAAFRPALDDLRLTFDAAPLAEKRRRAAGVELTSYTRLKQAEGGHQPPTQVLDEEPTAAPAAPDPGRLSGGALSGVFLHALLETVPLESFAGGPTTDRAAWAARPEIAALFEANLRRFDRDPAHRADAERMVHAALTTPLALPGGDALAGVAAAARVAREVEFLFPFPPAAGGAEAGFVKGYVDVVFEHAGRTYFGDWKSDLLPDVSPAALAAHVEVNYELQRRLYALALVKMLGIAGESDYEARFGGTLYVFLRALPEGLVVGRPTWTEIDAWERALGADLAAGRTP
jgi:exodeoxyribonuclease V beta subunit